MYVVKNMRISTGNLDFHFWVRHGSTHAELEIKRVVVIPVDQIVFGFIIAMQQILAHRLYIRLKPVHSKFKEIVNCREPDRLFSCLSRILR